jgi:2-polyprenyl-3-methyl-5-hydroxy-6-metoxy-1,4-benzoquinol methylase
LINNEYVFYVSPEEYDKLAKISLDFELLATGEASEIRNLLVRLMYIPPSEVLDDKIALDSFARLPPFLKALIADALSDFREEQRIKENVTVIAKPQRDTARKVAKQYEENPYPRWISISLPEPKSRLNYLRQFFSENELSFSDQPFDILVPGCGTGQRAIQWAVAYGKNARVLAIDLSRSSLAYGIRKARELGVQNIDFAQADFNELDTTRKFHIVECTGVVHHTENPLQSCKSLVDLTLPGGLVHVSLYSELSRRSIVKVRNEAGIDANYLAENKVDSDYIRAKRYEMLIKTPEMVLNELPLREDFFDLSRCRDLLFNEVEHRFTIPQISAMIEEHGLEFRGFEDPQLLRDKFWSFYPKGKDRLNLEKWWEFEKKHPMIFRELYEIWSLKV